MSSNSIYPTSHAARESEPHKCRPVQTMQHLRLMISRISVTTSPPWIFRLLYFEKSLHFNNCYRIIYCDNSFREGVTALNEGHRICGNATLLCWKKAPIFPLCARSAHRMHSCKPIRKSLALSMWWLCVHDADMSATDSGENRAFAFAVESHTPTLVLHPKVLTAEWVGERFYPRRS